MNQVSEFLKGLPEPLRYCLRPEHQEHQKAFLRKAVQMWRTHRTSILEPADREAAALRSEAATLAGTIKGCWPAVSETFLDAVDQALNHAETVAIPGLGVHDRVPLLLPYGDWQPSVGVEDIVRFRGRGGASFFASGSPLRSEVDAWIEKLAGHVAAFAADPLHMPSRNVLGLPRGQGRKWTFNGSSYSGLWGSRTAPAPWLNLAYPIEDLSTPQNDETSSEEGQSGKASDEEKYPPHTEVVPQALWNVCWWHALEQHLPLGDLADYRRLEEENLWGAGHVLDLILGPQHDYDAVGLLGGSVEEAWLAAMEPPYRAWLGGLGFDTRRCEATPVLGSDRRHAYWAFRERGDLLALDVTEPYTLMLLYCLETLADAAGQGDAPADMASYRPATKILEDHPRIAKSMKVLHRILADHPEIRTNKPSKQRLCIHLVDWQRFVDSEQRRDLDADGFLGDPDEIEERKEIVRRTREEQAGK